MTVIAMTCAAGLGLAVIAHSWTQPIGRLPFDARSGVARRARSARPTDGERPRKVEPRKVVRLGIMTGAVALAIWSPFGIVAVVVFGAASLGGLVRSRRRERTATFDLSSSLAEAIDLFAVALHSGHNLPNATRHVAAWATGDVGEGLRWCCEQVDRGHRLTDVLDALPARIGSVAVRPFTAALIAHERHGAPIGQALAQLAADARADRRRQAEAAARKLPISLLFPLVVCVLPAFVLLTVVPVVAEALSSFVV